MNKNEIEGKLILLFEKWSKENALKVNVLPPSGSSRIYYRIFGKNKTALGVYNSDYSENLAFINFTEHFYYYNLPVPEIYSSDLNNNIYLIEDLGNITLFHLLQQNRHDDTFPENVLEEYKKTIELMPRIQVVAGRTLDYQYCYPRQSFDKQSMMWDLNYFKYYFLKLAKVPFDEQKLENDFEIFTSFLLEANRDYFLYRDFQSRNIMIYNESPYFIDYQGGRKGALQYDIASLLYDAKANIPQNIRVLLLDYYLEVLAQYEKINKKDFINYYYGFVIIRVLQAMGAYGFRGFYEKKEHFLLSIPYALSNLSWLLENIKLPINAPHLFQILKDLTNSEELKKYGSKMIIENNLSVTINSFSYKRGIPPDENGNGGGFVFDCRAIDNPGRKKEYEFLTGKDIEIIDYLKKVPELAPFLSSVYAIVDSSIDKYLDRRFNNLMVSFGCTGGQHRSVFCAEALTKHIKEKYNISVKLRHIEQELKTNMQ